MEVNLTKIGVHTVWALAAAAVAYLAYDAYINRLKAIMFCDAAKEVARHG
ncbi:MAG: hypothetical protein IJS94_01095 [Clostridia bacterium]|nr:hypothetical protein [Clostridia bacterium]